MLGAPGLEFATWDTTELIQPPSTGDKRRVLHPYVRFIGEWVGYQNTVCSPSKTVGPTAGGAAGGV